MGDLLSLPRLSNEKPIGEPQPITPWTDLARSIARVACLPIRSNADLQEAILVLKLANAQTKMLSREAANGGVREQVSAQTGHVDELLDELRARSSARAQARTEQE